MKVKNLFISLALLSFSWQATSAQSIENESLQLTLDARGILVKSKQHLEVAADSICFTALPSKGKTKEITHPKWGKGEEMEVTLANGSRVQIALYQGFPFAQLHQTVVNQEDTTLRTKKMVLYRVAMHTTSGKPVNALGTGGLTPLDKAQGSYSYSVLVEPDSRHSLFTGWLTQERGLGVCLPRPTSRGGAVDLQLEFGNYVVASGKERATDTALIGLFSDGRDALERYADYLAKTYDITLPEKPNVYCTWYHRNLTGSGASNEKMLLENADFSAKELAPFGLNVMQIDDHWQDTMIEGLNYTNMYRDDAPIKLGRGPVQTFKCANFNFPSGMEYTAKELNKRGFTAGIWFMPFSGDMHHPMMDQSVFAKRADTGTPFECDLWSGTCIDATSPAGEAFLRERFKRIYHWGYRYFKIDGLHTGAPSENVYPQRDYRGKDNYADAKIYNDTMTFVQCFRRGLQILREEAPDVFLMGCCATQNMSSLAPSFGYLDGMRVGPDNDMARVGRWKEVTLGARYASNLYFLNNKVWYNDPDAYYVRESISLPKARWMVSFQSILGAMSMTSMQYSQLPAERLELIKRGLPTHSLMSRPADLLRNPEPQIWTLKNERMTVAGLFNWKEKESDAVECRFEEMGLAASKEYEAFEFWSNRYLGKIKDGWTATLDSASCQVVALRESKPYPQVISTSRHITQGLMDIASEQWNPKAKELTIKARVISSDPYELRITLPDKYQLKRVMAGGEQVETDTAKGYCRVRVLPSATGEVEWKVQFK